MSPRAAWTGDGGGEFPNESSNVEGAARGVTGRLYRYGFREEKGGSSSINDGAGGELERMTAGGLACRTAGESAGDGGRLNDKELSVGGEGGREKNKQGCVGGDGGRVNDKVVGIGGEGGRANENEVSLAGEIGSADTEGIWNN